MFKITHGKLVAMLEVSRDIGQVCFASSVVEPIVSGNFHATSTVMGFALSIIFFGISILFIDSKIINI